MRPYHFECRYYSTDQMLAEYVRRILCRNIFRFGTLISLVALVFTIFSWLNQDTLFFALDGVCFLIVFLTMLLSPPIMIRQMKENDRRLHNGQKFETIVQFGDRILIREGTFSLACTYDQIIKTHLLKHSYIHSCLAPATPLWSALSTLPSAPLTSPDLYQERCPKAA